MARFFVSLGSIVLVGLLWLTGGCSSPKEEAVETNPAEIMETKPETVSLLGEPLYAHADVSGFIANANLTLTTDPENLELVLKVAEIRSSAWQYRGAIELYDRAIRLAPDDWRPYRHRGHRYISIRQFDKAVADLEKTLEMFPYHLDATNLLGLAYYLQGRFGDAADVFGRCLAVADTPNPPHPDKPDESEQTCLDIGEKVAARVAVADWAYRALRRAGRDEEARALLESIDPEWEPQTNVPYFLSLLFYKGLRTEEEILSPVNIEEHRYETLAYGIASWYWVEGEESRALELLNRIVEGKHWPGFGRIAAEADLARLKAAESED